MTSLLFGVCLMFAKAQGEESLWAQNEAPKNHAEAIWKNFIPAPDSTELASLEDTLIRMTASGQALDCPALQDAIASLASAIGGGSASKLYPDVFNLGFARCPDWSPYAYILIGNIFFNNQDFEKAANIYNQAAKGLDPNQEAHLTATLNSGACYISLGQSEEAISAFQSVIDHAYERADLYQPMATINLSAAQIDAGFLNDAVHTIRELPTEALSEFWRGIHFSNALIAHQKLADYTGSDSVWQNHLSIIPFESLPLQTHPHVLSELLHRGDYIAFSQFRDQVLRSPRSPLLNPSHSHHQLFEAAENPTHSNILWELYRKVEDDLRKAHTFYIQETQPQLQSELQRLQKELGQERLFKRNWKLTTAFIVAGLLGLLLVIFILRTRRLRKHLLLVSQLEKTIVHQPPHVDEDDLVVLAQALTYGKGLQKALLIVRRLRAEFANHELSRLNLETIDFYEQLNEREREVAGYVASGFNSKEIAQLLNVTIQYIYNVRSRIRDKIGVPSDIDLLDWFREAVEAKGENNGVNSARGTNKPEKGDGGPDYALASAQRDNNPL